MDFFGKYPNGLTTIEYGTNHLLALAFIGLAIIMLIIFRNRIKASSYEKKIRYTLAILAIGFELGYKIWFAVTKQGPLLEDYLPLDLCAITLYLTWALLFTNNKFIFKLCYFYSIGALFSLFIPNMGFGLDHFRYYHYFFVHGIIIFAPIYYIAVHGYIIKFKDLLISTIILLPFALLVMGINFLIDANYMFLRHKPDISTPLDLFGPWPDYIFGLIAMVIALFLIWYIPWFSINREKKSQENYQHKNVA